MAQTVIGLFDSLHEARRVVQELVDRPRPPEENVDGLEPHREHPSCLAQQVLRFALWGQYP